MPRRDPPSNTGERKNAPMFFAKLPVLVTSALLSLTALRGTTVATASDTDATTVAAPATTSAPAEGREHGGGLCQALSCTDAQKAELSRVRESIRAARKDRDHGDERAALADMLRDGSLDASKVQSLLDRRAEQMRARDELLARGFVDFAATLDASQRAELADIVAQRGMPGVLGGMGKHHGAHGKGHGGKRHDGRLDDADDRGPSGKRAAKRDDGGKGKRGDALRGKGRGDTARRR